LIPSIAFENAPKLKRIPVNVTRPFAIPSQDISEKVVIDVSKIFIAAATITREVAVAINFELPLAVFENIESSARSIPTEDRPLANCSIDKSPRPFTEDSRIFKAPARTVIVIALEIALL